MMCDFPQTVDIRLEDMDSGSHPLAGYGAYQDMGFWNVHVPLDWDWLSLFRVVGLCISLTGGVKSLITIE